MRVCGSQLMGSSAQKLSFVATGGSVLSVWVLSPAQGQGWERHAEVDMAACFTMLELHEQARGVELESFGHQRSGAVFVLAGC